MGLITFIKSKFTKKIELEPIDSLYFYRQYTQYGTYSDNEKIKREKISQIIEKFKMMVNNDGGVCIESKFNGLIYPFFDLDEQYLDLFKKLYASTPYVIFKSSTDHYWGFLDTPKKNNIDIFYDHNWKICNDQKYINFSREYNRLFIRGLYEKEERRPRIFETNGNLSKNFQLFIDKLSIYYSKEGLELSVLRYQDPTMLIKFNRRRKLRQLKDYENSEKILPEV
jgi:hypothetical protein